MGVPLQPQLLAHLAGVVLVAGTLPIPANISYAFDESNCILSVQWADVRPSPRNSCDYYTGLYNGHTWVEEKWSEALSKKMAVPLGKNMSFGLRTSCNNSVEGELFKIPLEQNGKSSAAGFRQMLLHNNLEERQQCTNHSVDGDTFQCIFPINCSENAPWFFRSEAILKTSSRCVCSQRKVQKNLVDYPIKLYPPTNLKIKGDKNLYLTWNASTPWNGICYQVETNGVKKESQQKWREPDEREKFEALHIILFVMIPLCAAVLTIILLVYLKRIQLLIFPIIPDPEKVLKRMFEDQREEYLPFEYPSEFIKPDIIKTDYKMS
ncbi:hypothetical protein E2320_013142 [Naja naja]|nr:hypothetical protein E2320_013142 [Naja naja]